MAGYSDEEYAELLKFLENTRFDVQRMAAEGVLGFSEDMSFVDYCKRNPRSVARPLLRLAERVEAQACQGGAEDNDDDDGRRKNKKAAKLEAAQEADADAAGTAALTALVNVSVIPPVRDELIKLNAPRRAAETLRSGWLEGRASHAHWYAMLLANTTNTKDGQDALTKDEPMLRFLFAAYVANVRPPPRDGYDDPLGFLGKVLTNVCALPEGRSAIAGGDDGPAAVERLLAQLTSRNRRSDILFVLRNLCVDEDCHGTVVAADFLPSAAVFLYPLEETEKAQRELLPESLLLRLASAGAALTGDDAVRLAASGCLAGLTRSAKGREYLRSAGGGEVVRAWSEHEKDDETKAALAHVAQLLRSSESDIERSEEERKEKLEQNPALLGEIEQTDQKAQGVAEGPPADGPADACAKEAADPPAPEEEEGSSTSKDCTKAESEEQGAAGGTDTGEVKPLFGEIA